MELEELTEYKVVFSLWFILHAADHYWGDLRTLWYGYNKDIQDINSKYKNDGHSGFGTQFWPMCQRPLA